MATEKPIIFEDAATLNIWFLTNHSTVDECWIGFYKKGSGRKTATYDEASEISLCFGWVETKTKKVNESMYMIRYTPRKKNGIWSKNNIEKMEALIEAGMAEPAGIEAFNNRKKNNTGLYSYENVPIDLAPSRLSRLMKNSAAWNTWEKLPPGYRKTASHWVERAKQEATRERRFEILLESSASGRKIPLLRRAGE